MSAEPDQQLIEEQLARLRRGFPSVVIERPLYPEEDVYCPDTAEQEAYVDRYDQAAPELRISVFIPASGMATRMFRGMQELLKGATPNEEELHCFANSIGCLSTSI